ncbi:piggyBac transposable element-derived protein 4 isoform X1 [Myxocyprinus asiaticus]|uniref:piggyBac transposable element-derived protein 4 isoform X1 n=1 Tax=Myxocyprinus asiaticus TaxID=70543 RepID=UPI002223B7AD|nr:piggyBac transposable element-derived protein 4 isoform X1 [Myxocyprinus asiaticus]
MSTSVDIHAQLASIVERFAKCALLEMSRAVDQEINRRQMEVETLMVKLQFTESELRKARQNQPNLRSVGTQANDTEHREINLDHVKLSENHEGYTETQTDDSLQTFTFNADGIKSIQIKEEHMEEQQWHSGQMSPALCPSGLEMEDQDRFSTGIIGTAREGSHHGLSEAERLLYSIAEDNSDIEEMSDGEEIDPEQWNEDQINDYPPLDHDSCEDSENDDSDEISSGRGEHWVCTAFNPDLVPFQAEDKTFSDRLGWQPVDYVNQYIDSELMKLITDCSNATALATTGTPLNATITEMYHLFGASILMSCVQYPEMRMFWSNALRIPAISDRITRGRFFKLRSSLKVVIDTDVPEQTKSADRFWKVRPFLERVRRGCLLQFRPECVSIDEQMVSFTGACPFRQYMPSKPNPVGMKNFVLASASGIVLDFLLYQGAEALCSQDSAGKDLGLGGMVVAHLAESLHPGSKIYCDRFFTNMKIVDHMIKKQVYVTGTVMQNRVAEALKKLPGDKTMELHKRGATASVVRRDGKVCVLKWYDDKPYLMLSTVHGEQPYDTYQRWSKQNKEFVNVKQPSVVREYKAKMAGFDLAERMISSYCLSSRTKRWTIRMLMHFTDLALVNSWLLYQQDNLENGTMEFLEFRTIVAQTYLAMADSLGVRCSYEEEGFNAHPAKRCRFTAVPHISVRTTSARHLPEMVDLKNAMRCRRKHCNRKSRVRCVECNVFLCLRAERNCFAAFHSSDLE